MDLPPHESANMDQIVSDTVGGQVRCVYMVVGQGKLLIEKANLTNLAEPCKYQEIPTPLN